MNLSLQRYNKAIAAGVVALIALLGNLFFDYTLDTEVELLLIGAVTTFLVYLVPNKE